MITTLIASPASMLPSVLFSPDDDSVCVRGDLSVWPAGTDSYTLIFPGSQSGLGATYPPGTISNFTGVPYPLTLTIVALDADGYPIGTWTAGQ